MSTHESVKTIAVRSQHWHAVTTWLLLPAIVLPLFIRQQRLVIRQQRLEHDLDLGRRSTEHQIEDVKEAIFGVLQHDLLRYDELNKRLEAISTTAVEQAKSNVKRNRSELATTFARKQDVTTQLSDLRSELKQDTAFNLTQLSSDLRKTNSDLKRVVSKLDMTNAKVESNSEQLEERGLAAAPTARPEHEQVPPKRKRFWSKLNLFSKNKAASSDRNTVE
jgi:hypothetical protein